MFIKHSCANNARGLKFLIAGIAAGSFIVVDPTSGVTGVLEDSGTYTVALPQLLTGYM